MKNVEQRIGAALLAMVALAACSPSGPTALASPSPSQQNPSPIPTPSPAFSFEPPSPTPTPSPRPVSETLHCRLPISAGQPGSGGFVVFPGGKFVADPASNVVIPNVPSPSPGYPYGYQFGNFFGLTYDRPYSKWLPVPRQMVTPDGSRYAYQSPDSVYVVNVVGGAKIELGAGHGHPWNVFDVESDGVYATPQATTNQAVAGLWFLSFTGAPRQVTTKGYWTAVGGGAAYGFEAPGIPSGAVQRLMRLDLKTGVAAPWFDNMPPNPNVLGFDLQGHPIVSVQGNPSQVVLMTGKNQTVTIIDGSVNNLYVSWVVSDRNGTWMAAGDGVYLYRPGAGLERATVVTGPLGGPCA